jgi:hypothetical protein
MQVATKMNGNPSIGIAINQTAGSNAHELIKQLETNYRGGFKIIPPGYKIYISPKRKRLFGCVYRKGYTYTDRGLYIGVYCGVLSSCKISGQP